MVDIKQHRSNPFEGHDPQSIASDVLAKAVRFDGKEAMIGQFLGRRSLRDFLFRFETPDQLEDTFGFGHGDIDQEFDQISKALLVASFNRIDRDALSAGEETLSALIVGVREQVQDAKDGINPTTAEGYALQERLLKSVSRPEDPDLETPVSPNEIDRMQQEALASYRLHREALQILVELRDAVRTINGMLDREHPERGPAR
jgi:hypothetical protein